MVGFVLAVGPGWGFPAEDVNAVFHDGGRDPAPGRGKVRLARPPIGRGVVFLRHAEVLAVLSVQPAADRVKAAVERGGGMVVAGRRHQCACRPAIGRRVIDLMRGGIAVLVIAAYRMELPVKRRDGQRSARGGHGLASRPAIGSRVVLVHAGHRRPDGEQRAFKPADDVEPVIDRPDSRMVQAAGERGTLAPGVGGRIVFLDGRRDERQALLEASDHVDLATDGGDRHFGALERGRRPGDPLALRLRDWRCGD